MTPKKKWYQRAFMLALVTIIYNVVEGLISTYVGFEDQSLALFGFGADSFIEVISGVGIAHMVIRITHSPDTNKDGFERTALRITGFAFYILVAGLVVTSIYHICTAHRPLTTFWGVVISLISILTMWFLVMAKRRVGHQLGSAPILADANCTLVCVYMSIILLVSSGLYELFGMMYVDSLGTLGLAYFAYTEGRECFEKANSDNVCCGD